MQNDWLNELTSIISKEKIFINEPMQRHTSFKIGGPAEALVKANSVDDVKKVIKIVRKYNIPFHIIGNGSNLLINDDGVEGIVLKIEMSKITINKEEKEAYVIAECGVVISALAYELLQNGVTGFEELSGIPRNNRWSY